LLTFFGIISIGFLVNQGNKTTFLFRNISFWSYFMHTALFRLERKLFRILLLRQP